MSNKKEITMKYNPAEEGNEAARVEMKVRSRLESDANQLGLALKNFINDQIAEGMHLEFSSNKQFLLACLEQFNDDSEVILDSIKMSGS
jgi:hypothetical protein